MNIIQKLGGSLEVAYGTKVHQISVDRWAKEGIPPKHWQWFIEQGVSAEELYKFNQERRATDETTSN